MNADLAFQNAANLAYARSASPPAYISYVVRTHIAVPRMHRERNVDCREVTRTIDGVTYVADLPNGGRRFSTEAFPLPPSFNAVSAFDLRYGMSLRGVPSFHVSNVRALTYHHTEHTDADAVVVSTRGYRVSFAADSSEDPHGIRHIVLTPTKTLLRNAPKNTYFFSEMSIDNASGLPLHVSYVGANDFRMVFDYATNDGNWYISRAHLESTLAGPFGIGRVHFLADTDFSEVTTSQTAPPNPTPTFPNQKP
jgi:hypothetical protein